jgi:mitogen-activated protein kinase 1/3
MIINYELLEQDCQSEYQFCEPSGFGSTAMVFSAIRRSDSSSVAIRVIPRLFEHNKHDKRVLRELRILRGISHPYITNLLDLRASPRYSQFNIIYLIIEKMDCNLRAVIEENDLTCNHRSRIIFQLCHALKHIHSINLLHRDIKPENILVNSKCQIKVCDFDMARIAEPDHDMTEYVTTRWYRAPELLLEFSRYDTKVDMWSVGCVLADLILKRPFAQGRDTLKQLELLAERLGNPTEHDLRGCQLAKAKEFMAKLPRKTGVRFEELFEGSTPEEIDFLKCLLVWDPTKRMSAEQALQHPYFRLEVGPEDVGQWNIEEFEFEGNEFPSEQLRPLIWGELLKFHPEYGNQQ